jgi:hypothetical protein
LNLNKEKDKAIESLNEQLSLIETKLQVHSSQQGLPIIYLNNNSSAATTIKKDQIFD